MLPSIQSKRASVAQNNHPSSGSPPLQAEPKELRSKSNVRIRQSQSPDPNLTTHYGTVGGVTTDDGASRNR